jgi:hypothetical protein
MSPTTSPTATPEAPLAESNVHLPVDRFRGALKAPTPWKLD